MPAHSAIDANAALRARIRERLANHARWEAAGTRELRAAAVAVPITEVGYGANVGRLPAFAHWQTEAALLLTRRAESLRNHPGQWAFPGGRCDPGETVVTTALREMQEEVGVGLPPESVLGLLDDFVTRSGFVMTPVVVWAGPLRTLTLNRSEVASAHPIPMSQWLRKDAPVLEASDDSEHPILRMPVGNDWIAAPTAAIIYQFRELCLRGLATRVHHFEQPEFARR